MTFPFTGTPAAEKLIIQALHFLLDHLHKQSADPTVAHQAAEHKSRLSGILDLAVELAPVAVQVVQVIEEAKTAAPAPAPAPHVPAPAPAVK